MASWKNITQKVIERPEQPPQRSKAFWGLLILADLLLMLVFSWSLTTKIYLHLSQPYAIPLPKVEPPAAAAPQAPVPEATIPAAPPAIPSAKVPAPTATPARRRKVFQLPGFPSAKVPAPTATPAAPQHSPPASPSPAEQDAPGEKAQRVTFEFSSKTAKDVQLTGGFIRWKPKPMIFNSLQNTWSLTLYLKPGNYQYHFMVDGQKTLDPSNPLLQNEESVLVVSSDSLTH